MKTLITILKTSIIFPVIAFIGITSWKFIYGAPKNDERSELCELVAVANHFVTKAKKRSHDFLDIQNDTPYKTFVADLEKDITDIRSMVMISIERMLNKSDRTQEYKQIVKVSYEVVMQLIDLMKKLKNVLSEHEHSWAISLGMGLQKFENETQQQVKQLNGHLTHLIIISTRFDSYLGTQINAMRLNVVEMTQATNNKSSQELLKALAHRLKVNA